MLLNLREASGPLYRRVYHALKGMIRAGRLGPTARVPSTRALARDLGVSRNTVMLAYEQLAAEGYLVSRHRGATSVAGVPPPPLAAVSARPAAAPRPLAVSAYARRPAPARAAPARAAAAGRAPGAALRLPLRPARGGRVPARDLASSARRAGTPHLFRRARLRRTRGLPPAAGGPQRVSRARPRRGERSRPHSHRERDAAGAGPDRARAARPGRRRGRGGAPLPGRHHSLRGGGRAGCAGGRGWRGPAHRGGPAAGRAAPPRLRGAVPSGPQGGPHRAASAPRPPPVGGARSRPGGRGRLRGRVPLRGPSAGGA